MKGRYRQSVVNSRTHFTHAPQGVIEFSRMHSPCKTETTGNAGDIIPLRTIEVLPNSTFSINADFDIRQATALVPSMDNMIVDVYAFFVPNRVVNKSWKSVQGENQSGQWVAPEISLAPLCDEFDAQGGSTAIQIPPNSVADYYGYPTQEPIPYSVLQQSHDLLFRGYLEIYNNYFRNQNYQPPIPYSKLNVYNGFMLPSSDYIVPLSGKTTSDDVTDILENDESDDSYSNGSIVNALYGEGSFASSSFVIPGRISSWSALSAPLKANKLHDYFTSVLPSPQKGREIVVSSLGYAPVVTGDVHTTAPSSAMRVAGVGGIQVGNSTVMIDGNQVLKNGDGGGTGGNVYSNGIAPSNLYADLANASVFTLNDMRMSAAIQQVYEILGTSGSRYVEFVNSFFGLEVENPFDDIPTLLGHCRRNLDLYQVAQTSQGEGSSVGSLGAFGYTSDGGKLFDKTFLEHGYIHILGVIRHRNVYPSTLSRDKFRMSQLDFYLYPLANIGEQPVYTREINPFASGEEGKNVFGYQEAWSEYRFEPDIVTGLMRTGAPDNLAVWNYADDFDRTLQFADGEFMKSNSAEVLNRSIAIADSEQPQFKIKVVFDIVKQLPMPTYSMPGLDIF